VRWEARVLLLDAKDQEVLIDGAMTPVMRLKLIQSCDYWDVEEECNDPIEERAVYTQNIPSPLREKLTKKKKESFIKGIQRLHVATRYLLRNHQLPTVDWLLDLLAVSNVEGVDWCMHTEQEYDDDGKVLANTRKPGTKRTGPCTLRAAGASSFSWISSFGMWRLG